MTLENFGYVRVACAALDIKKANTAANTDEIIKAIKAAEDNKTGIILFPEFAITGNNLGQLFLQKQLHDSQQNCIDEILEVTCDMNVTVIIGYYQREGNSLCPMVGIIKDGEMMSIAEGTEDAVFFDEEHQITFGFTEECDIQFVYSSEAPVVGQMKYLSDYAKVSSSTNHNIVVLTNIHGTSIIAENGKIINSKSAFTNEPLLFADVDTDIIRHERVQSDMDIAIDFDDVYEASPLFMWQGDKLLRNIRPNPFEPETKEELYSNCFEIFEIQSDALAKRLAHTHSKVSVVGISGGLDSTLALLVTAYAHHKLGKPAKDIIAVTMPGFGTTDRTYDNALDMMKSLGATVREISIVDSVTQHFKDIDHDINDHSVTYENAQARERTQILMDIANKESGIVVGTGDLSEEALGWCTFNGDHISMFGVNAGVPKTVIKFIVRWFIDVKLKESADFGADNTLLAKTLEDILETPISPELLPPDKDGNIAQKTEENVGPYELHDFFIFHTVRHGVAPKKLLYLATLAFKDKYDEDFIAKWLKVFYRRFFTQQFKRSCSPDSPQVGTIDLSPVQWEMPSDAFADDWLCDI